MEIIISSFYKYVNIKSPVKFQEKHIKYCNNFGIKGKVLVAKEGINGSISGTKKQINEYENFLRKNKLFNDIKFKHNFSDEHPFKKIVARVKKEIVTSGLKVNLLKKGAYVTPTELNKIIEKDDNVILLDVRNNYESKIGKFRNSITPNLETFREFKKVAIELKNYKDKKIITYCTGGVRCEKASAFLKEKGFQNVFQLDGGILNYVKKFPNKYFQGRCFVFDNRLSIPTNSKEISFCEICHVTNSNYINCANKECDKLFICCEDCDKKLKHTCSKKCKFKSSSFK